MVRSHAIHYGDRGVSFICKKSTSATPDICSTNVVSTSSSVSSSINGNIRTLFGDALARDLLTIDETRTALLPPRSGNDDDEGGNAVTLKGRISNPNYSRKKSEFVIFINNRLVDCRRIRRAVEATYTAYLPKKTHPFVYLSLTLAPEMVDVNVHPTKSDVHFLHEDEIVGFVEECVQKQLQGTNKSRTFMTQTLLVSTTSTSTTSSSSIVSNVKKFGSSAAVEKDDTITSSPRRVLREIVPTRPLRSEEMTSAATTPMSSRGDGEEKEEEEEAYVADEGTSERNRRSRRGQKRKQRGGDGVEETGVLDNSRTPAAAIGVPKKKKFVDPRKLIRTDFRAATLDAFVNKTRRRQPRSSSSNIPLSAFTASAAGSSSSRRTSTTRPSVVATSTNAETTTTAKVDGTNTIVAATTAAVPSRSRRARRRKAAPTRREVHLDSILSLRKEIESREHKRLTKLVRSAVYVGAIDRTQCLLQHETKLYLARHDKMSESFFYQAVLRDFSNFERIPIEPPLSVRACLRLALDLPEAREVAKWQKEEGNALDEVAQSGAELLAEKADMLREYFGIDISTTTDDDEDDNGGDDDDDDDDGDVEEGSGSKNDDGAKASTCCLSGLPEILVGHCPTPAGLPLFLLELITEVDFGQERPCFVDIATCLARYYAKLPKEREGEKKKTTTVAAAAMVVPNEEDAAAVAEDVTSQVATPGGDDDDDEEETAESSEWPKTLEHTLFPALRQWLVPPRQYANDGVFVEVACLERLYRIFERC